MRRRSIVLALMLVAGALLAWPGFVVAQTTETDWVPPKNADGRPDLQGIWANNVATPLERPEQFGEQASLSDEELAVLTAKIAEFREGEQAGDLLGDRLLQQALGNPEFQDFDEVTGNYNAFWLVERTLDKRTSLIIDPPNGRMPPLTEAAQARFGERAGALGARGSDGPEDRTLSDRCLHWDTPNMGSGYNSYSQIFQTPDSVTIIQEMGHLVRTIPLDGRSHLHENVRQWSGSSRGHWEGDTLVVETRNYDHRGSFNGGSESLVLVERFNRVGPNRLRHEITLNDPETWKQPWTVELLLDGTEDPIFEYACHEGNYSMPGILGGARVQEAAAGEAP